MQRYLVFALLVLAAFLGYFAYSVEIARRAAVARIAALESRPPVAPGASATAPELRPPMPDGKASPPAQSSVDLSPYLQKIDELRAQLEDARKELREARAATEANLAKLDAQSESIKSLEASLGQVQETAAKDARIVEALQAELNVKSQRMIQAEQAEKVLQDRLLKAEQSGRRLTASTKELEDIQRRRENAYASLERRVRDVTEIIRGFTLTAQTRDAGQAGLPAGDLSRLQTALQQAEEDMRQIRGLNARAADLAKAK